MKEVILFTTGLDSFLTDFVLKKDYNKKNVKKVYINLNSSYSNYEVCFLNSLDYKDLYIYDDILDVYILEKDDKYVPNRNMMLCTIAQSIYDADVIYLNGTKCDRISDNTKTFRKSLSRTLTLSSGKNVEVKSVLSDKEKYSWCQYYASVYPKLSKRLELVTKTYSCFYDDYHEDGFPKKIVDVYTKTLSGKFKKKKEIEYLGCLTCDACFRKLCALTGAGLYLIDITGEIGALNYSRYENYLKDTKFLRKYPKRSESMREYFNFLEIFRNRNSNWVNKIFSGSNRKNI